MEWVARAGGGRGEVESVERGWGMVTWTRSFPLLWVTKGHALLTL